MTDDEMEDDMLGDIVDDTTNDEWLWSWRRAWHIGGQEDNEKFWKKGRNKNDMWLKILLTISLENDWPATYERPIESVKVSVW